MSLVLSRRRPLFFKNHPLFYKIPSRPLSALPSNPPQNPDPRSNLSARLAFVFDQIDAVDNRTAEKFDALQRIRQWRESRNQAQKPQTSGDPDANKEESRGQAADFLVKRKDVEVVHPWPEWIELLERLGQQNYFDYRRLSEERVAESVGIDLNGLNEVKEEVGFDFLRDWTTVRNACMNFGKDRFDIFRSLSKKDIQILVGHGCPSMDSKVVFSSKLLRKYTHLDEGDVCSSCSLRNSCSRGYILTLKEDEARTIDVMRVLLTYGFDHVNGAVENKPLMQMKSVKTVVRKLLHEIVKLSAVPIDPNLPPPVIKKPPLKVKQPPPPPKKRVGRDDVEMKKGDWLCAKCDFMNFAKNTVCLQCDAKRPKRQLLPGEWECPQCNFLNYRRNMACFHCDAKRPPDEFTENQFQLNQPAGPRTRLDRAGRVQDVTNGWNFDFDDNESDGADVAAFEFADSKKAGTISDPDALPHERTSESFNDMRNASNLPRAGERGRHFSENNERRSTPHADRTGFDDFDDEEDDDVDSYELDGSNNSQARDVSVRSFSEVEGTSDSEDSEDFDRPTNFNRGPRDYISGSEDDELAEHPQLKSSHVAESWRKSGRRGSKSLVSDDDDDDLDLGSDSDGNMDEGFGSKQRKNRQQSSGRKGTSRRTRDSDSDDGLLLDSDLDGDDGDLRSVGNKFRGSKGQSDRRGSNLRKSSDFGNGRTREFRSDDRSNHRNSFGGHDRDSSSRDSSRNDYGGRRENSRFQSFDGQNDRNRKNVYGERRGNDRFQRSDRSGDGGNKRWERPNDFSERRGNDRFQRFDRSSDGGNKRWEKPNQSSERRGNDRFQRFDRSGDGGNKKWEKPNQFSDRSRGSRKDERGRRGDDDFDRSGDSRNKRWGEPNHFSDRSRGSKRDERGWRGDDGFKRETRNGFRDRNRSFVGDDDNDRPRRVIER